MGFLVANRMGGKGQRTSAVYFLGGTKSIACNRAKQAARGQGEDEQRDVLGRDSKDTHLTA